ncbi:MAG: class I SAM-dependent methyltransferase [Chlorobi bacterium]|nr:class I SAM-dependent methyltransferase [Chlorobiota bacterium]
MIEYIFVKLNQLSGIRRFIWKPIYNYLAKRYKHVTNWRFMNYGYEYHESSNSEKIQINSEDENDRYCIQLYNLVANVKNLKGLNVLEVGCGRGGGVYYINKYLNPASIVGVDISKEAIQFCNNNYVLNGLSFIEGDAENLRFSDESFDLILNVESSMHYGSVEKFFMEVKRLLKPGGIFSIADIRPKKTLPILEQQIKNSGMTLIKETDISLNVVRAIELGNELKMKLIDENISFPLRFFFKKFAGVKGSKVFQDLISKNRFYKHYILIKN